MKVNDKLNDELQGLQQLWNKSILVANNNFGNVGRK